MHKWDSLNNIVDTVDCINNEDAKAEEKAAYYAVNAYLDNYPISIKWEIIAHLNALIEGGAIFDYAVALKLAMKELGE